MTSEQQYIKFLEDRLAHTEHMLNRAMDMCKTLMDRVYDQTHPELSPHKVLYPFPKKFPETNTCPKCGLHINGVMGYACPHSDCPTGLGPLMCGS